MIEISMLGIEVEFEQSLAKRNLATILLSLIKDNTVLECKILISLHNKLALF